MIDDDAPHWWPNTATVFSGEPPVDSYACPAKDQENYCGTCRACWDRNVRKVSYRKH